MSDPVLEPVDGTENDAYCPGDELVDWSRVDELPALIEEVGDDKDKARDFYSALAGGSNG